METNPEPIPPVEMMGTEQGDLPVNDPPPSERPEERSPVEEPKSPTDGREKRARKR
jgi:hypothetical protein